MIQKRMRNNDEKIMLHKKNMPKCASPVFSQFLRFSDETVKILIILYKLQKCLLSFSLSRRNLRRSQPSSSDSFSAVTFSGPAILVVFRGSLQASAPFKRVRGREGKRAKLKKIVPKEALFRPYLHHPRS